ncbi:MAG: Verru_Chthon cassette protein A [Verrucomicrobiales bacterium]|nr:Verru_Chthon cassette protein A [Verrucomicrobiales bacterium]
MKLPETLKPSRFFAKDRRGVALVTVLTVMALTTILVLTFFSLATSEHRASNTYSQGLQAQQVGEQAVNFVIAQIREATVQEKTDPAARAWASQPGAIRQWDRNGSPRFAYKLYSDDLMKLEGDEWSDFENDFKDAEGWSQKNDIFVDLNEPVIRGEKAYYPIVHPLASTEPKWPSSLGDDSDGVEGFRYNQDGNVINDEGPIGKKAADLIRAESHVPMPVRWIYQLADGTLGVINDGGGGDRLPFSAISGAGEPSARNPIVARFAFWADDETTKLNMNVHAGGLAWDVPKAGGILDMSMGQKQPAQKEWQRYPGHPASTHLIPALAPGVLDIVNDRDAMEMLFAVVPRVVGGGSESGTRIIDTRNPKEANGLIPDSEPLFPSLDDVIMRADRTPHEFPDARGRPIPPDQLSDYLERAKFFITVNSRAPETNLFNRPRIAMWPIYNATYNNPATYNRYLTPFDQLIHYCASIGKQNGGQYPRYEFVFKRQKADSATFDYEIASNRRLYEYLRWAMTEPIPGYGKSFKDKYGEDSAAQLATMAFDYIRSTNLHDDTIYREDFASAFRLENSNDHPTFTNPRDGNKFNNGFGHKGHGQVTPLVIQAGGVTTKGMGRFFTLASAGVIVASVGTPADDPDVRNHHPRYPGVNGYNGRHGQTPGGGRAYTNLPPLPVNVTQGGDKSFWPGWLVALEMSDPEEFKAAFDETQWNWQLAFLDPDYAQAVLADPTANKFERGLITKAGCEKMRLLEGERLVQSTFVFNLFCPSIGWVSINPNMEIEIEKRSGDLTFKGADQDFGFFGFGDHPGNYGGYSDDDELDRGFVWATNWVKPVQESGSRAYGGLIPFSFTFAAREVHGEKGITNAGASVRNQLWRNLWATSPGIFSRLSPIDRGYNKLEDAVREVKKIRSIGKNTPEDVAQAYRYDLVTMPFKVNSSTGIDFREGNVEFRFYDGGKFCENSAQDDEDDADSRSLVQTIELKFESFKFDLTDTYVSPPQPGGVNDFYELSVDSLGTLEDASLTADPGNPWDSPAFSAQLKGGTWVNNSPNPASWFKSPGEKKGLNSRGRMSNSIHWDGRYIRPGDIVQSVAIPDGDVRVVASRAIVKPEDELFKKHRDYGRKKTPMAHSFTNSDGEAMVGFNSKNNKDYLIVPTLPQIKSHSPYRNRAPLPFSGEAKSAEVQLYGDFDNGAGLMIDGPYINKPDEGNSHSLRTRFTQEVIDYWDSRRNYGEFPYFSSPEYAESGGPSYFSPNRIVSGPGMFGSLPTSLFSTPPRPWQTLLFRPNVVGNGFYSHPGAGKSAGGEDPPDHLFMDLFWMPVVEPYAISEPLSTAGKINMNYQILPFLHVHRDTALRGVFRSEFMLCIPNEWHTSYKHDKGRGEGYHWRDNPYGGALQLKRLRSVILEGETLKQFERRFENGRNAFKTSTEICEIHLVPEEVSKRLKAGAAGSIGSYTPKVTDDGRVPDMESGKYWRDHSLVGDNSRERPYTNIQTRLTTKSNTFQVHYRAQVLKQARRDSDADYANWRPSTDTVQAEYRGSSVVERYVDPNGEMPDFANPNSPTIDEFYRFRVINPRRFAP